MERPELAPLGLRFAAFLVDGFFSVLIYYLVFLLVLAVLGAGKEDQSASRTWAVLSLAPFLALLAYFVAPTALSGQTLGKRMTGIRVVDARGNPPGWGRALLRETLGKLLSGVLFLGYLVAFFHPERRALHDLIAGTWVAATPKREARPEKG